MVSSPAYRDSTAGHGRVKGRAATTTIGAKLGLPSVIPAAVAGTSVAIVTTGTATSTNTIVTGLLAGAATFGVCTGVGVVIGAGMGVAVGGLLAWHRRRKRDRELDLLIQENLCSPMLLKLYSCTLPHTVSAESM